MKEHEAIKHLKLCMKSRMFIPNNEVLGVSAKALENQLKIKELLNKRDNASCSDSDTLIKDIMEVLNS